MELPGARPLARLVTACVVLGAGVALLLDTRLGADGYATLIYGIHLASGVAFWMVNVAVGILLVAMAVARGVRPGIGTLAQPVVVGVSVSLLLPLCATPDSWAGRSIQLAVAFGLLTVGVAAYLQTNLGAGPTEAAALAWDPPLPFRWSYGIVQVAGSLVGWLLEADVGAGTVIVALLIGPAVDRSLRLMIKLETGPDDGRRSRCCDAMQSAPDGPS